MRLVRVFALTRLGWVRLVAGGVVVGVMFLVITSLYDAEGQLVQVGGSATKPAGFEVSVSPIAVQPATGTATVRVALMGADESMLDETGRLGQPTRLTVITDNGVVEDRFPAGTVPGALDVSAGIDGDLARYPFDDHAGRIGIVVDQYNTEADGSIVSVAPIPIVVSGAGGATGWITTMTVPGAPMEEAESTITFERAFSTRAFALLIVGMSVMLAALSLTVGVLVRLRRRVVEATLLSWAAALLFALPAMRNFMPGSPPIGVALDVYVFLWVMVAAVFGVVLAALAWIERDRPTRQASRGGTVS